jgi:hypothetical protein
MAGSSVTAGTPSADTVPRMDTDRGIEELAEAFSRHRFEEVYPYLADAVRWDIVGDRQVLGQADVVSTCERSAGYLAGVTTDFRRFRVVVGGDCVVVDSEAEYVDGVGESSVVASCDLYDFSGGRLAAITSYTVELGRSSDRGSR